MTEGPLNGRHVLVLDSVKTFCFLELPAEIRVMIYRYLIEEPEPIKIRTFTLRANGHRAVRAGFEDRKNYTAHGLKFNQRPRKYIGQPASYFALAAVNKQMPQKHVPLCMATMSSTSRLSASSTTSRLDRQAVRSAQAYCRHGEHLLHSGQRPADLRQASARHQSS